jgi:hypothetical protein
MKLALLFLRTLLRRLRGGQVPAGLPVQDMAQLSVHELNNFLPTHDLQLLNTRTRR